MQLSHQTERRGHCWSTRRSSPRPSSSFTSDGRRSEGFSSGQNSQSNGAATRRLPWQRLCNWNDVGHCSSANISFRSWLTNRWERRRSTCAASAESRGTDRRSADSEPIVRPPARGDGEREGRGKNATSDIHRRREASHRAKRSPSQRVEKRRAERSLLGRMKRNFFGEIRPLESNVVCPPRRANSQFLIAELFHFGSSSIVHRHASIAAIAFEWRGEERGRTGPSNGTTWTGNRPTRGKRNETKRNGRSALERSTKQSDRRSTWNLRQRTERHLSFSSIWDLIESLFVPLHRWLVPLRDQNDPMSRPSAD